jgi:hypothetical protein
VVERSRGDGEGDATISSTTREGVVVVATAFALEGSSVAHELGLGVANLVDPFELGLARLCEQLPEVSDGASERAIRSYLRTPRSSSPS